jgi:hypothetical protein
MTDSRVSNVSDDHKETCKASRLTLGKQEHKALVGDKAGPSRALRRYRKQHEQLMALKTGQHVPEVTF